MNNQTLIHPDVVRITIHVLSEHGFAGRDLDDAVAEVNARVIEHLEGKRPPQRLRAWQKLVAEAARIFAVQVRGRRASRNARQPAFCRDPEAQASWLPLVDPRGYYETQAQLDVLLDMLADGELPEGSRAILEAVGEGAGVPEAAQKLGLTPAEVRERLRVIRARFFRRLRLHDGLEAALACLELVDGDDEGAAAARTPETEEVES